MENLVMENFYNGIYKNKRVLVTGHTGFKGSWLSLWLTKMGANVLGYALEPERDPNHFSMLDLPLTSIIGDIRNADYLLKVFERFQPEIVFHLAAQPLVRRSYKDPIQTIETNVMGTVNVFESCRQVSSVRAILNVTSDKCYQNKGWLWGYRENDRMGGYDPYSASKGCAELITSAYRNSFFNLNSYKKNHQILLASARAGNVIGGGDWAKDRIVTDAVESASKNESLKIRYPKAIRPWQHVLEPLSGYLLLGQKLIEEKKRFAEAWNFGPSDDGIKEVIQVVKEMKKTWGKIDYEIDLNEKIPHEAPLLILDSSKSRMKLKWKGIWHTNKAILKTAEWYKAFYETGHVHSEEQLKEYLINAKETGSIWAH
jgi:CDP-glucose 4,6-dehydratase